MSKTKPTPTAAERTRMLLAFKKGFSHNFTLTRVAPKPVQVASSRFATS
jgi:hypothetical protein